MLEWLQRPELDELRTAFSGRIICKNDFICHADSSENSIFIVTRGRARLYLGYEDKEFNLAILSPGDIYSTHTGAYVQAMEEVEVLVMDALTFRRQKVSTQLNRLIRKNLLRRQGRGAFEILDITALDDYYSTADCL